jgi:hypothetical protein
MGSWINTHYFTPQARLANRGVTKEWDLCPSCNAPITIQVDTYSWCYEVDTAQRMGPTCSCEDRPWERLDIFQKGGYYSGMIRCSQQESEVRKAEKSTEVEQDFVRAFERVVNRRFDRGTGEGKGKLSRRNQ